MTGERQRRHEVAGVVGERDLDVATDLVDGECSNADDFAARRFQRSDSTEQAAGALQRGDAVEQAVAHLDRSTGVDLGGAGLLAEPDDSHLRQPTLDRALEARVRLDPVDRHDPVGARGVPVEVQRHAVSRSGNFDGLHRRSDLAADR